MGKLGHRENLSLISRPDTNFSINNSHRTFAEPAISGSFLPRFSQCNADGEPCRGALITIGGRIGDADSRQLFPRGVRTPCCSNFSFDRILSKASLLPSTPSPV